MRSDQAGALPAGVVVKLVPFSEPVLQHFNHLERPDGSPNPTVRDSRPNSRSSAVLREHG